MKKILGFKFPNKVNKIIYVGAKNLIIDKKPSNLSSDIYILISESILETYQNEFDINIVNLLPTIFNQDLDSLKFLDQQIKENSLLILDSSLVSFINKNSKLLRIFNKYIDNSIVFLGDILPDRIICDQQFKFLTKRVISFCQRTNNWFNSNQNNIIFKTIFSVPIPQKYNLNKRFIMTDFYKDFKSRPFDILYYGTPKEQRYDFLGTLIKQFPKELNIKIISCKTRGGISNMSDYFNDLSTSRFVLSARSSDYLPYPSKYSFLPNSTYLGQYTGRASEAIAASAVPIHIQSKYIFGKYTHPLNGILRRIYKRYSYLYANNSSPYDFDTKGNKPFIAFNNFKKLAKFIFESRTNPPKNLHMHLNQFYTKYISSSSCFEQII